MSCHIIRHASIDELDKLCSITTSATEQMNRQGILQWDDLYPSREILLSDIERQEMHVVCIEDTIAGLIVINNEQPPEYSAIPWKYSGSALVIHRLAIDPLHQGRGLATKLIKYAEEYAVIGKYDCIRLDTFTNNPTSNALYKKLGYIETGIVQFRKGSFCCYEKNINEKNIN